MKLVFWIAEGKEHERQIAEALRDGVATEGHQLEIRHLGGKVRVVDCDAVCLFGVKGGRKIFDAYWAAGIPTIYFDKGYIRQRTSVSDHWRVAINAHHPTRYLMEQRRPGDRYEALGVELSPWRERGDAVVIAGSSAKYHEFAGLPEPTRYAQKIVKQIRARSPDRPIIYRPKPSWNDAVPIEGTIFSKGKDKIGAVLEDAHALVTHGSNACWEAVAAGVPCIILGDAVAKPLSSTRIADLENPWLASYEARYQWFSNLAYCQWSNGELRSGEAWSHILPLIKSVPILRTE